MNLITKALTQGHTSDNVLQYLLRHFPKHKKQIEKALAQGFTADRIIQFLGGGRKEVNRDSSKTLFEQARDQDKENVSQVKRNIGKGALLAGGAVASTALSRALPQTIHSMLGNEQPQSNNPNNESIPKLLMKEALNTPPQQENIPQTLNAPSQQPPVNNPLTPSITQSPQNAQPEGIPLQEPPAPPLPEALHKQVKSMLEAGNDIPTIDGTIKQTQTKIAKEYEKTTGQPIARAIEDFAKANPIQARKPEPMGTNKNAPIETQPDGNNGELGRSQDKVPNALEKKTVALPNGDIGEVTNIRQGIATVNVAGKEYRRKLEDLVEEPEEAAMEALELIKSFTPEQERSAHHALNMYDDEGKKAIFLFHNGDGYIVDDITPEEYERLSTEVDAARTSGKSPVGIWATGAGSRGAAYQNVVKDLKKPYRKIKVGYNLFKNFQKNIMSAQKKKKSNEKSV